MMPQQTQVLLPTTIEAAECFATVEMLTMGFLLIVDDTEQRSATP